MCIAGKNDLRVPPSQGYEFYHALKVGIGNYDQILHTIPRHRARLSL